MADKTDVQNVTILFEAIIREREALLGGRRPDAKNWFKKIDGPPDRGIFFTGDDGWEALSALTDSAMRIGKITRKADRQAVRRTLAEVLMRKFATEGLEIDERNVARALSETFKSAIRAFTTQTHFIPCHLSTGPEEVGLSVGPVRFLSRKEAKALLREALRSGRFNRDRSHALQAVRHYKGFRWFAEVKVADCASKRSEDIALATATSALDFVQLFIGARHSRRMLVLGQPSSYQRMASIMRDEATGGLGIATGWKTLGENSLPDGWTEAILEGEGKEGFERAGMVLEARLNPDLEHPLSLRMLDAVHWFGEAVRDSSPSTRVIKYVTALERLTLTKKVDDVSESVSARVAALVTGLINEQSFEENRANFKKIYSLRSDLVHGSVSPNDPKVEKLVGPASEFSQYAIKRALYNWPARELSNAKSKVDDLDHWFDQLVEWMKAGRDEETT